MQSFKNIIHYFLRSKSSCPKTDYYKMATIISCSDKGSYKKAAELLASGQVIAVPTDTIYGFACSANSPQAIQKLYSIKGRDSTKPVALCVATINDLRKWGKAEHLMDDLLHNLFPGPVTVVLDKTEHLNNPYLNPKTTKIGIRIPNHEFICKVMKTFEMPVALTSANFSNETSTLSVKEFEQLYEYLGAVFDGGVLSEGLDHNRTGSTVVDLSVAGYYNIIRKGISYERIVKLLESYGYINSVTILQVSIETTNNP